MEQLAEQLVNGMMIGTGAAVPIKKWNPYAFRVTIATPVAAPQLLKTLQEKFQPRRVAMLYDITQDALRAEAELFRESAKKMGYEMVAFESFRVNDTDFRSFPEEPTIYSVYGYQALQAAVDAVKRSCTATDREKFRDALGSTNLNALAGSVVFKSSRQEPNGENQGGAVIISHITGRDSYEVIK